MKPEDDLIKKLKKENKELKKENEYFKSPLFMWDICQVIKGEYSILLSPPKIEFHSTKNQKACSFKINVNDIICVLSSGKTKWIYFKEPQSSLTGISVTSDKLSYTGNLHNFCKMFDNHGIHLCQISRSVIVNVFHYYLDRKTLRLIDPHKSKKGKCDNLPISYEYLEIFLSRKSTIKNIATFLKIDFRGKFSPLTDLHDSFEG
ncbi:MAG: hypothetical protein QM725_07170 [Lacibacter sp.]|jgi:hypothetical protein|nr:hypothetical protein [Ferruginibacter sp.]HMP20278.1 hypothetical protein [Ferruginibacter sp.]